MRKGRTMTIGPVQLLVLGFDKPDFEGEILDELERLRESDTVRVIDSLGVYKDADGEVAVIWMSNISRDEAMEIGSVVGALNGLGTAGDEGRETSTELGAEAATDGNEVFSKDTAWDALAENPED